MTILNKKSKALLQAGRLLFWKYGFRKVSVDEICAEAQVSKMTFYRNYADKLAFARAVYQLEVERSLQQTRDILQSNVPAHEKMHQLLMLKASAAEGISEAFMNDFYKDTETALPQFVLEQTNKAWFEIVQLYKDAQLRGDFRDDFKPEFMLLLSQKMIGLITDPELTALCGGSQAFIMELSRLFAYRMMNPQ